jgi:AraC-like DNA-binding protein
MTSLRREPGAALQPYASLLWLVDERTASPGTVAAAPYAPSSAARREHVVPTGQMHLVFRLQDDPLRILSGDGDAGTTIGHAVIGGPRAAFHVRELTGPSHSLGVQLRPDAAAALFGAPALEFAGRHVALDDVWGRGATEIRERLQETPDPRGQLSTMEDVLVERLRHARRMHPAVRHALSRFRTGAATVSDVVRETGYSHRMVTTLFARAIGMTPKRYCRLLRMQRVLRRLAANPATPFADLAAAAGYSDQPHFTREFREFAGVTPEQYRAIRPAMPHHIPTSISFKTPRTTGATVRP